MWLGNPSRKLQRLNLGPPERRGTAFQWLSCHTPLIYYAEGGLPIGQCGIDLRKGLMNGIRQFSNIEIRIPWISRMKMQFLTPRISTVNEFRYSRTGESH